MTATPPLTVSEVATRYGVTNATVRAWIASGELQAVNVSRKERSQKTRWRVTSDAITAFEERRKPAPALPRRQRRKRPADVIEFIR